MARDKTHGQGSLVDRVRYHNFRDVISGKGANNVLAQLMACSPSYVSLLLSGARRVNADNARGLEAVLGLPSFWMDAPQSLGSLTPEAVYRLQTGHSPIKFPDFSGKRGRPCSAGATRREQTGSEIDQVRYRNLTDIIIPVGLKKNLAQLMACSQGHVSHLLSGNRRVTRDTARGLEEVLGLPPLWMDTLQTPGSLTPEAVLRLKTGESPIRFPTSRAVRTETRLTAAGVRRLARDLRMLRFDLNTTAVRLDAAREVLESVRIRTKSVARMQVEGDISPTEILGRAAIALRKLDEARMLVEGIGIAIAEVAVTGNI